MSGDLERKEGNSEARVSYRGMVFPRRVFERMLTSSPGRAATRLLVPLAIERVIASLEFDRQDLENVQSLGKFLSDGYKLIVVANHQSLGDLATIAFVAEKILEVHARNIEGFDLFAAKTMGGGQQGKVVQTVYKEGASSWIMKQKINIAEVVSDNDVASRGMIKDSASMLAVARSLRYPRKGILVFPEGTMEGGRRNAKGELNGVGRMSSSSQQFIEFIVRKRLPVVFLPVGTHGMHEIFSPSTKNFTKRGMGILTLNSLPTLGRISFKRRTGMVSIGEPFAGDDLNGSEDPALEVMRRISLLVPEEARGIFRQD